eukprot:10160498-Ditylum_brightwellii.AAC.1
MSDKSTRLFSAVEKDPNSVYYFVTKKALREEVEAWNDGYQRQLLLDSWSMIWTMSPLTLIQHAAT